MLFGTITRNRYGNYILKVDGHPDHTYMYYTKREAIRRYRDQNGLRYKRITWEETPWIKSS